MVESLGELAIVPDIVLVAMVVLMIAASTTSIGRALLPNAVVKLIPRAMILDADVTAYGDWSMTEPLTRQRLLAGHS